MSPRLRPLSPRRYGRAARRVIQNIAAPPPEPRSVVVDPQSFLVRGTPFTAGQVRAWLADSADFWWLEDRQEGVLRLASTVDGAPEVLKALLGVAERESLTVEVRHRRSNELLDSTTRNALGILNRERFLRLVLRDRRSAAPPVTVFVEAWQATPEGHLSSPHNNWVLSRLWRSTLAETGEPAGAVHLKELLDAAPSETVTFPIDWVFSWVDASDPAWQEMFAEHAPEAASDASDRSRFATRDDLKYALRALDQFAPWIRTIHVLTNCRPPAWLDTGHERINWVDHSQVFEPEFLPTFSSHSIETVVHRIPGLAEHFVYSNDDFFLTRQAEPSDFFYANGVARLRLEGYGMVNGPVTEGDPDYLNGARNAAALLRGDFGVVPVRLHTHSPQSMNKAVLEEMEQRYPDDFKRTRANRFRHFTDVAVTGFLYHHYAFLTGRAVPDGGQTLLVQQNHRYARTFNQLLDGLEGGQRSRYLSVCVNDGRGSHENADWDNQARSFLQRYFPRKSQFERQPRSAEGATAG